MQNLLIRSLLFVSLFIPSAQAYGDVILLRITGIINPVIGNYVVSGIKEAERDKAAAVIIELDTPGGLLDATRTVISAMLNTDIPVIVHVAPRGARATSAGVFITMASDVAVMAKDTHLGAAHPVNIQGETPSLPKIGKEDKEDPVQNVNESKGGADGARPQPGQPSQPSQSTQPPQPTKPNQPARSAPPAPGTVMEEKMVSDAAAYIRTLATEKGRNALWAERAVRESVSLTAEEALKENVIDLMANDRQELLKALQVRKLKKNGKDITLDLAGAAIKEIPLTGLQQFLHMLAHPNVAYILLTIGIYGLIYEFATPGVGFGGVVGAICLLLALFSLQVFPINAVGAILIGLGVILLLSEMFLHSHGVLTLGGLISFGFGSFMLIDVNRGLSIPSISLTLILPTVAATGLFLAFIISKVIAARLMKPRVGMDMLVGQTTEVQEELNPQGLVYLNGELWTARIDGRADVRDKVEVVGFEGNVLIVRKKTL